MIWGCLFYIWKIKHMSYLYKNLSLNSGNAFTECIRHNNTYGEITTIEWMDNKCFISQMNYSWNPIACLQGCHWSRDEITAMIVFNCPVVITFFNILRNNENKFRWYSDYILVWFIHIDIDAQFHIMFGENASSSKTINENRENVFQLGINGSNE